MYISAWQAGCSMALKLWRRRPWKYIWKSNIAKAMKFLQLKRFYEENGDVLNAIAM